MAEDQDVGVREPRRAPHFPPLGVAGLVHHREPDALDLGTGDLGQPFAQRSVVVVAVHAHEPPGAGLDQVQQRHVHPVAGMDDDVGGLDRDPQRTRKVT